MPRAPVPLNTSHRLDGFDCGKLALNEWLVKHALRAGGSGSARTFIAMEGADDPGGRVFQPHGGPSGHHRRARPHTQRNGTVPDSGDRLGQAGRVHAGPGQGIGVGMLKEAIRLALLISEQAGIRALLTHLIDEDAARFHSRFGFIGSPLRDDRLLLLLKEARAQIR